jgi:hypothetical protein
MLKVDTIPRYVSFLDDAGRQAAEVTAITLSETDSHEPELHQM